MKGYIMKEKKLVLDSSKCIMCGACTAIAPNNCAWVDGSDTPVVINDTVTPEAENATSSCPTGAVHIEEK